MSRVPKKYTFWSRVIINKVKKIFYILAALISAVAFTSCEDDDTFSASPSNVLTMVDTLSLDTVFTRIPSSSKSFWIYNKSGDGIRCANIKLQHGNQTGFRVNVDGQYLGENAGYQLSNVEIRKGDSIRVFVELTSKQNYADGPQLKEENLVILLESGVQQKVNLRAMTWDADTVHTLRVSSDTTIANLQRPLIIFKGIEVDSAATLTIGQGTTLYFHDDAGINVSGTLKCKGDSTANIVLRSYRLDNMFDYLKYEDAPGHWQGIHFTPSSYGNEIDFTDLHGSYDGIVCDSSDVSRLKLTLLNSTIHNCQGYGVKARSCQMLVGNCQITNTLRDCFHVVGGDVEMYNCTLAQFYPFDANRGNALYFSNTDGTYNIPLEGFTMVNSIVTGYAEDVILGTTCDDSTCVFAYRFHNDILRTEASKDTIAFTNVIWETPEDSINGDKHFVLVDIDKQRYDFHLDSLSTARGKADPKYALPFCRDGRKRDENYMNLGCY